MKQSNETEGNLLLYQRIFELYVLFSAMYPSKSFKSLELLTTTTTIWMGSIEAINCARILLFIGPTNTVFGAFYSITCLTFAPSIVFFFGKGITMTRLNEDNAVFEDYWSTFFSILHIQRSKILSKRPTKANLHLYQIKTLKSIVGRRWQNVDIVSGAGGERKRALCWRKSPIRPPVSVGHVFTEGVQPAECISA